MQCNVSICTVQYSGGCQPTANSNVFRTNNHVYVHAMFNGDDHGDEFMVMHLKQFP